MSTEPLGVAIVGCGHIATGYARDLRRYPRLVLRGVTDLDPARSRALATEVGCRTYRDFDALLADPEVAVVVNLTSHRARVGVTHSALEAGKHVFSEKPMALGAAEARSLNTVADARSLRLGSAPIVLLGELAQTAWRTVRNGDLERSGWRTRTSTGGEWSAGTRHPSPSSTPGRCSTLASTRSRC